MTDFRARPRYLLRGEVGTGLALDLSVSPPVPDEAHHQANLELIRRVIDRLPDGVRADPLRPRYEDLLDPPGPEPFAAPLPAALDGLVDPETHWARLAAVRDRLDRAGVIGAEEVLSCPSGWVRLMEGLAEGVVPLLETEPEARLRIGQIKEKFGTLRVYADPTGSDRFVDRVGEVIAWAVAASEARCALTGLPGVPDRAGWHLTLCPEAIRWRREDRRGFGRAIYPDPPGREAEPAPTP